MPPLEFLAAHAEAGPAFFFFGEMGTTSCMAADIRSRRRCERTGFELFDDVAHSADTTGDDRETCGFKGGIGLWASIAGQHC